MIQYREEAAGLEVRDRANFDKNSGSWLERLIFNHRFAVVVLCLLATIGLGFEATKLKVNANFERMIPQNNPYIRNYLDNKAELPGLGNAIRIVVETKDGDILNADYIERLRKISDTVYLIPGVDRSWMKSLWMPLVRWMEVTEQGQVGGPVMPEDFNGSPQSLEKLRINIAKANLVGSLVGTDMKSTMLFVPLLDYDPRTGAQLDYAAFSQALEKQVRSLETPTTRIHIVGFAKVIGDLIDGLTYVAWFFAASVVIATAFVYLYTRDWRSTLVLTVSAILGVVWMLGLMHVLGYELDPYSILVPFLIFAIGLSHGAQRMNGILQDVGRGMDKYVAARYTFRRLFLAGLTALLTNIVGFAVLVIIDIPVIRDLAIATSIGVAVLVFTKLFLIPVALSYTGVSESAARRALAESGESSTRVNLVGRIWAQLDRFCERRWAMASIAVATFISVCSALVMQHLTVGDTDPGAPELRQDSRYNRDNDYITRHYSLSSDQFAVIIKTPEGGCQTFRNLTETNRLSWALLQVPGVQATSSLSDVAKYVTSAQFEGNPKWTSITRNQAILNTSVGYASNASPELTNPRCAVFPLVAYLEDHKAETLERVLHVVEDFAAKHNNYEGDDRIEFLPAAGSAGIEAMTNIEVRHSIVTMYLAVYGAVALLCLITFRSIAATLIALVPLVITSLLCKALMVWLGIGLKVATLPVIAVGVGVGVDYALYLLSVQIALQRKGVPLKEAYRQSLEFTGKIVALVGLTMAAGVITWAWSPIKFQADMGILLTFMFLWNMLGALVLIPALSCFLLRSKEEKSSRNGTQQVAHGAVSPSNIA